MAGGNANRQALSAQADMAPTGTPPVSGADLKAAMRELAGGVCVITVGDADTRTGLTATSLVPVSLDPPEVLVTINQQSSSFPELMATRRFGVNLLAQRQQPIAERFAGKGGVRGTARYEGARWQRSDRGVWLLQDALAALECDAEHIWLHRTHALVIGRVRSVMRNGAPQAPLVYWQGNWRGLAGPLPA